MDGKTARMRVVPCQDAARCRPIGLRCSGARAAVVDQWREYAQHEAAGEFVVIAEVEEPLRLQPAKDGSLMRLGHPNPVRYASAGVIDRVARGLPRPKVLYTAERLQDEAAGGRDQRRTLRLFDGEGVAGAGIRRVLSARRADSYQKRKCTARQMSEHIVLPLGHMTVTIVHDAVATQHPRGNRPRNVYFASFV